MSKTTKPVSHDCDWESIFVVFHGKTVSSLSCPIQIQSTSFGHRIHFWKKNRIKFRKWKENGLGNNTHVIRDNSYKLQPHRTYWRRYTLPSPCHSVEDVLNEVTLSSASSINNLQGKMGATSIVRPQPHTRGKRNWKHYFGWKVGPRRNHCNKSNYSFFV